MLWAQTPACRRSASPASVEWKAQIFPLFRRVPCALVFPAFNAEYVSFCSVEGQSTIVLFSTGLSLKSSATFVLYSALMLSAPLCSFTLTPLPLSQSNMHFYLPLICPGSRIGAVDCIAIDLTVLPQTWLSCSSWSRNPVSGRKPDLTFFNNWTLVQVRSSPPGMAAIYSLCCFLKISLTAINVLVYHFFLLFFLSPIFSLSSSLPLSLSPLFSIFPFSLFFSTYKCH